jgi:hypothetical protein
MWTHMDVVDYLAIVFLIACMISGGSWLCIKRDDRQATAGSGGRAWRGVRGIIGSP